MMNPSTFKKSSVILLLIVGVVVGLAFGMNLEAGWLTLGGILLLCAIYYIYHSFLARK